MFRNEAILFFIVSFSNEKNTVVEESIMEKMAYNGVKDLTPDKDRIAVCEGLDGEGCDSSSQVNWWESPDGASDAMYDDCIMEDADHGGAANAEFNMAG